MKLRSPSLWLRAALLWLLFGPLGTQAQPSSAAEPPAPDLGGQVLMVPKTGGLFSIALETTVYRPPGEGPFPLVVINHGKAPGDPRFQSRYQPLGAVRFFLARGYAVIVPMRQGFSKSSGGYIGAGCNVESNGHVQAEDVHAVYEWLGAQAWADRSRMLVMGQSHGGWTTLAYGTHPDPGVRALVNFAGGLRQEGCTSWEQGLAHAAGAYGEQTRLPSLWFYGDNDRFFSVPTFHAMFDRYRAGGAPAELIAYGVFGVDSHAMFGSRAGEVIWQGPVSRLLRSVGLPDEVLNPAYLRVPDLPTPPATGFAALDAVDQVPMLKPAGREAYRLFLGKPSPRAFALGAGGAWGWAEGGDAPLRRALANCEKKAQDPHCQLYAVDDQVVWRAVEDSPP